MLAGLDTNLLLSQLAEAQPGTFVIKDLDHRYVVVNRRFADSVGLPARDIVGRSDAEIGAGAPRGDHDPGGSRRDAPGHDARTVRAPILDADGAPVALLIQSRDIGDTTTLRRGPAGRDEALAARDGQLGALADVLTMLTETLVTEHELPPLLDRIVRSVVACTRADEAWLWMCEPCGDRLTVVAGVGADRRAAIGRSRRRGEGFVGRAWQLDGTLHIADAANHPALRPHCSAGTEVVALPLRGEHDIAGLMTVSASPDTSGRRLADELALLEKIGELASIAIANAQRMAAARAELRRTRALTRLGRRLSTTDDPEEDLDGVCRALAEAIDIDRAGVHFVADDGTLRPHVAWTIRRDVPVRIPTTADALARESIAQWCRTSGMAARIGRHEDDPRESARVHAMRRECDIGSTCCVPITRGGRVAGTLLITRARDQPDFDDSEIELCGSVVDLLSIALERHSLSVELEREAHHDSLTRLPNRRRFERVLARALEESGRGDRGGAVMFLDLDGFKPVNDRFGHAAGDALLRLAADRLTGALRAGDVLARMGGDEFAVLSRGPTSPGQAVELARRLVEALRAPFDIGGAELRVGASVGIGLYPEDGREVDDLLRRADAAMYQAKRTGKGRVVRFDRALESDARRHAELECELRDALAGGQLALVYQPQVSCATGRVEAVQALVHWVHPVRGTIPPIEFVPIAEAVGMIGEVGTWALDEALRERASWRATGLDGLRVSIDVAAAQLSLDAFADRVLGALARHGVSPAHLELEITESALMDDLPTGAARLDVLRRAGVRIAIDDFGCGTGHSSLGHLQALPLDALKIAAGFVARLGDDDERSPVNLIRLLASGLGLDTVAEGVETEFQRDRVAALGCDRVQGRLHSPPVSPADLPGAIRRVESGAGPAAGSALAA